MSRAPIVQRLAVCHNVNRNAAEVMLDVALMIAARRRFRFADQCAVCPEADVSEQSRAKCFAFNAGDLSFSLIPKPSGKIASRFNL